MSLERLALDLREMRRMLRKEKTSTAAPLRRGRPRQPRPPQQAHLDDVTQIDAADAAMMQQPRTAEEEALADMLIEQQKEAIKAAKFAHLKAGKCNPHADHGRGAAAAVTRLGHKVAKRPTNVRIGRE